MESETNNVTLVKVSKEEKERLQEDKLKAKRKKLENIPEKDLVRKKEYQIVIAKTLVLFILALLVLGLLAVGVLDNTIGILCLIVLAVISTIITRTSSKKQ